MVKIAHPKRPKKLRKLRVRNFSTYVCDRHFSRQIQSWCSSIVNLNGQCKNKGCTSREYPLTSVTHLLGNQHPHASYPFLYPFDAAWEWSWSPPISTNSWHGDGKSGKIAWIWRWKIASICYFGCSRGRVRGLTHGSPEPRCLASLSDVDAIGTPTTQTPAWEAFWDTYHLHVLLLNIGYLDI